MSESHPVDLISVILLHKYVPELVQDNLDDAFLRRHEELLKIMDFIELPENVLQLEQQNSTILRTYYANSLDHNNTDIKTVKYIFNQNIRARGFSERSIEQYIKAEKWLESKLDEGLQISMLYHLQQLLIRAI